VKPQAIAHLIKAHREAKADHSLRLWVLLQLELWHREVVESPPVEYVPTATMARDERGVASCL
jgi:hypothetical protein